MADGPDSIRSLIKDMDVPRAFYADKQPVARHPEKVGPINLREES